MEKFGVEVNKKIWYVYEKHGKNYIFKLDFYTLLRLKNHFETIFRNSSHVDFKNGIRIEFSCTNDGKIRWWRRCKIRNLYEKMEKIVFLTRFLYLFKIKEETFETIFRNLFHVDFKKWYNNWILMQKWRRKERVEVDPKFVTKEKEISRSDKLKY